MTGSKGMILLNSAVSFLPGNAEILQISKILNIVGDGWSSSNPATPTGTICEILIISAYFYKLINLPAVIQCLPAVTAFLLGTVKIKQVVKEKPASLYPYKLCRLFDFGGDLSQSWYIIFYIWNVDRKKLVRKRDYSFNVYTTESARRTAAIARMRVLDDTLEEGAYTYDIDQDAMEQIDAPEIDLNKTTIIQAFDHVIKIKADLSPSTLKGYVTSKDYIEKWLKATKQDGALIKGINRRFMYTFFDWLQKKIGKKSYNNYKGYTSTVFNYFVDRDLLPFNPVKGIRNLKTQAGRHVPYTKEQLKKITRECVLRKDKQLLLFIQFIYYAFARPKELGLLKIGDIHSETIYFSGSISKNDKSQHVFIPPALEKVIKKYKLRDFPPQFYLFSTSGKPGPEKVGVNYFYKRHRNIIKDLEYTYDDFTLYGYKHTGNIALFQSGADIKLLQRQNRHSTIQQTDTYLKHLGLFRKENELDKFPKF